MIRLILTDMDGTLLNEEGKLPKDTERTIAQLMQRGIRFGAASGREFHNLRSFFPQFQKEMIFIAENGTLVYEGEEELLVDAIDREKVIEIVQKLRTIPNSWMILCGKETTYIECRAEEREAVQRQAEGFYQKIAVMEDALAASEGDRILEISIYCRGAAAEVEKELLDLREEFTMVVSSLNWIDILNPSAGKGNALRFLQERYGLREEECMVFGDYLNDREMLLYAGESYAMENAHPELYKVAKKIAPSNRDEGVIQVLRSYFELED